MHSRQRLLLILPALLLLLSVLLVEKHGPYYLGQNFDPEYAYLLNSLNILTLNSPGHTDHPGTTLQELGAAAVFARWAWLSAVNGWEGLRTSVLSHPEDYLRVINFTLNLLFCALLFLVSRALLRRTGSLVPPFVFQATFLAFGEVLAAQTRVSPEPLLLSAVLALIWALLPAVLGPAPEAAAHRPGTAIAAGVVFGFGVVTKVTFLPLAALALVLPGWKQKGRFAAAAAASSLILLAPIFSQLGRVAQWFVGLLVYEGRYGEGDAGLPSLKTYFGNLLQLFLGEPALYLLLAFHGIVLLILWRRTLEPDGAAQRRFLFAALLAAGGLIAITGKHYAAHYALPAMALTPALSAIIAARALANGTPFPRRPVLAAGAALTLLCLALNAAGVTQWLRIMEDYRRDVAEQMRLIAAAGDCQVAGVYRASLPSYALHFGNGYSNGHHRDGLQELFPETLHFNIFDRRFEDLGFTPRDEEVRRILSSGGCVLLQGEEEMMQRIRGFNYEVLRDSLWEVPARLHLPSTGGEAGKQAGASNR